MDKNEILKILEMAKDKNGEVPMRLVRQAFEKLSEPCEDTISRHAAIDAIMQKPAWHGSDGSYYHSSDIRQALESLPSAQPESCGDAISREYLKEHIEACWINGRPRHAPELSELLSWIDDVPSAQPEPQWIPCSERLPEESGRYLVTRGLNACGSLWNRIYIANYSDLMGIKSERIWWQGNVGKSDFERLDDVLAWMPLPEPYKGK